MPPLVSIICLSYNHQPYIREALNSVFNQTYKNIEVIVIDDASIDGSQDTIKEFLKGFPHIEYILLPENLGNCKAFNLGLSKSKGKYIIDFALDDVLLPTRIEKQVAAFELLSEKYGVVFSDVLLIDQGSRPIKNHYKRNREGFLLEKVPQGDVYKELLEKYFISPPSMIVKREVLVKLKGYDETLAYEDFDFWVRSSRDYYYHFMDEVQTLKRVVPNSHGSKFNQKRQEFMHWSTLKVCEKALRLNMTHEENEALAKRVRYHMKQALFTESFSLVEDFYCLLTKTTQPSLFDNLLRRMASLKIPLFKLYKIFR